MQEMDSLLYMEYLKILNTDYCWEKSAYKNCECSFETDYHGVDIGSGGFT